MQKKNTIDDEIDVKKTIKLSKSKAKEPIEP